MGASVAIGLVIRVVISVVSGNYVWAGAGVAIGIAPGLAQGPKGRRRVN